jgi:SSS family solute:Na+ symporter
MAAIGIALAVGGVLAAFALAKVPHFAAVFPASFWFNPFVQGVPETLANVAALIVGMICTQTYIQAMFSATDSNTAARGTLVAAVLTIPVGLPGVAIGMAMHLSHPHIAPIFALPLYLVTELPPVLGGIGLAGILFSAVGSIAGLALGIGTMVANDLGRAAFAIPEAALLWINRATVMVVTVVAVLIALANPASQVLAWNYLSMALRGAGVFLPMALAIFRPHRLGRRWAAFSILASTALAVIGHFVAGWPVQPLFLGLFVSAVLVAVGVARARAQKERAA